MNYDKILNDFLNAYYQSKKEEGFNEFRYRTSLHFLLSLEIAYATYSDKEISFEMLCDKIPRKWGSKNTIQSMLKDAVQQNYFEKSVSKNDGRIKFFKLSNTSKNHMQNWLKNRKNVYLEK